MSNLLLSQGSWADGADSVPPLLVTWNNADKQWGFDVSTLTTHPRYLKLVAIPNADDFVAARVEYTGVSNPGSDVYFLIWDIDNGQVLYSRKLYSNQAAQPGTGDFVFNLPAREHIWMGLSESPLSFVSLDPHGSASTGSVTVDADGWEDSTAVVDTYSLKAFYSFSQLVDNTVDTVALVGELSAHSRTFAKDRAIYGSSTGELNTAPTVELTVFSSKRVADQVAVPVPAPYVDKLLSIGRWCFVNATLGNFGTDSKLFYNALIAAYPGLITQATIGPMRAGAGVVKLPEYIDLYMDPNVASSTWGDERNYLNLSHIRIWLSDAAFQSQYDEYDIEIVAPLDDIDQFFQTPAQVSLAMNNISLSTIIQRVNNAAGTNPYTVLREMAFKYKAPSDDTFVVEVPFFFVIYGRAGDGADRLRLALQDWILSHSSHSRDEWITIFPDIFLVTEFVIVPMWSSYAIPNQTLQMGVHSPSVTLSRAVELAHGLVTGYQYSESHINSALNIVSTLYESLQLLIVGGPNNSNGLIRFNQIWKDYITTPTSSTDFNRMSPTTQRFVLLLEEMLKVAETATGLTNIPADYSRITRTNNNDDEVDYVSINFQGIQYLVATKESVERLYPSVSTVPLTLTCNGVEGVTTMPSGAMGVAYHTGFQAVGGTGPYTYALNDAPPVGVSGQSIDPQTGVYQATFNLTGQKTIAVTVTDGNGDQVTISFSLYVSENPLSIDPLGSDIVIPAGNGTSLTKQFLASGGEAPYTYSIYSAQLISGGIDETTGLFSGAFMNTPVNALRVRVTDSVGSYVVKNYTVYLTPMA